MRRKAIPLGLENQPQDHFARLGIVPLQQCFQLWGCHFITLSIAVAAAALASVEAQRAVKVAAQIAARVYRGFVSDGMRTPGSQPNGHRNISG